MRWHLNYFRVCLCYVLNTHDSLVHAHFARWDKFNNYSRTLEHIYKHIIFFITRFTVSSAQVRVLRTCCAAQSIKLFHHVARSPVNSRKSQMCSCVCVCVGVFRNIFLFVLYICVCIALKNVTRRARSLQWNCIIKVLSDCELGLA